MATVTFNSTTEKIWSALVSKGVSKHGAAALLGNMYAKSSCFPSRVQGDYTSGFSRSVTYTNQVNSKQISEYDFVHNGPGGGGYGLCQWTYSTRKQRLYDLTIKVGKSINNVSCQVDFAIEELKTTPYTIKDSGVVGSTVWDVIKAGAVTSVEQCSNAILFNFEKPDKPELKKSQRIEYSKEYYNNYIGLVIRNDFSEDEVNNLTSLVNIALAEEGNTEYPMNSNTVKYNTWFYGREVSGPGYPWCMAFVQWCCNQAGISVYKTASCGAFLKNTSDDCFVDRNSLTTGDIVFFTRSESIQSALNNKRADHVGIVVANNGDGTIITIEGNTSGGGSQDNGGMVKRKLRYLSKPSLNQGGGIVCGIRLVAANAIGGTTHIESAVLQCVWIVDSIARIRESMQERMSNITGVVETFTTGSAFNSHNYEYKEFTTNIQRDKIISIDEDANVKRTRTANLLTTPTFVESPFILLTVGKFTFGSYSKTGNFNALNSTVKVDYPNYMNSINVVKINGVVNQYTIQMTYQIQAGQDPNLIDKIFSTIGYGTVYISYGDWNYPSFIYKREEAIITDLISNVNFAESRINYTLKCTSNPIALMGGYYNFPARESKPSDILYNMLYSQNATYRLLDSFPGMKNQTLVRSKGLIRTDDSVVKIEAKSGIDALSYVNYLVSCMSSSGNSNLGLRDSNYYMTICDDTKGEFGGSYFKITKVASNVSLISLDSSNIYEIDVGYPGETLVTEFSIKNDNCWSLLYNYSNSIIPDMYSYNIDNNGNIIQNNSPSIMTSSKYGRTTETQKSWWTQMTQFPISATLTVKGLVRPALLMTYLRINALFYGQRHISSGIYIITKQEDRVDARGYRTTLSLTRIAGDLDTIQSSTETIKTTLPVASR